MTDTLFDIIDVRAGVEEENEKYAQQVRAFCREHGIYLINLMASPGAGKTTLLCRLLDTIREECGDALSIGIIEADVDADVDARTVTEHGAKAVQLHTGGSCHMDAAMTLRGLESLVSGGSAKADYPHIIILENIGNLVCPAEFDVGADLKLMILSVPEGDDKPLKYPLMFQVAECLVVNKTDTAGIFDFDLERCKRNVESVRESMGTGPVTHSDAAGDAGSNAAGGADPADTAMPIFPLSAKTGEGFAPFVQWLKERAAL